MRSIASSRLLALSAAFLLSPSLAARADEVSGARSSELLERAHAIRLKIEPGHAELAVRRTVWNGGPRHDEATIRIELPSQAVATGLRTLGSENGHLKWFEADLMEAEAAAKKYQELTGIGGYYPKDPALLSWRSLGNLMLQVFPVAPKTEKVVEYTLAMPTHYHGGRYHIGLGAVGTLALPATLFAAAPTKSDGLFLDDAKADAGAPIRLDGPHDIALPWRGSAPFAGALAVIPVGQRRILSRFHVEAAAHLSRVPDGAYVVVVLDASRSVTPEIAKASVAAADAVLGHFRGAHVEVITFDRVPHERHGAFVSVEAARADLAKMTLRLRNGSRLDDALARADALLQHAPAGAARRILAISDLEMRAELTPERLKPMIKSGAVLHIGVVEKTGEPSLTRDDDNLWTPIARATGGLVWKAHATEALKSDAMTKVYEEWARPVRLDHPRIVAPGLDGDVALPESLDEGEGLEDMRINQGPVREVVLEGELWSMPSRTRLAPDADETKRWSALVFGQSEHGALSEPEMMVLARLGHAVSPVTSLLAVEPGVRSSTEGLEQSGIGEGGGGRGEGIGIGSIGTISHCGGSFNPDSYMRDAIRGALTSCGARGRRAMVELETTSAEIVEIGAIAIDGVIDPKVGWCVREAVWELELPMPFVVRWSDWTITV